MRNVLLNSATIEDGSGFEYIASGGSINAYQALLAETENDASSKAAASGPDMDGQAVASGEGGGGGGCLIESGRNPGSALALATLFSLMVLSRVSLLRHQG
jgi:hypothetical protein